MKNTKTFNAMVSVKNPPGVVVPATIVGYNLELFGGAERALLTDRLANPKFNGPVDPRTGIAPGWFPPTFNFVGIRYELTAGEGLMGGYAQLLENTGTDGQANVGLVQPEVWIRKGETLEVVVWARVIHHPVAIRVGIQSSGVCDEYDSQKILINSACWREYRATLTVPCDDNDAVFFCYVEEKGIVQLDQVHLRPAGSGVIREDVLKLLGEFRIPVLRFPGGCITTSYHWRYGTGPHELRPLLPDPAFKREISYEFGTDEYLEFCLRYGIIPHITVNIGTGAPGEAVEWAAPIVRHG